MSKFNEREKSFEKKFQIDEELKFKILGINTKEKIQNYIQEVIKSDLQEAGQEDVFHKIKEDFQAASISMEDKEIRNAMETSLQHAKEYFKK